jgi:hypothetical protein
MSTLFSGDLVKSAAAEVTEEYAGRLSLGPLLGLL